MRIWFALVVAPTIALVDQSISYAAVAWACMHQQVAAVHVVHFAALVMTVIATLAAWQLWRTTRAVSPGDETLARRRFLAGIAVGAGTFSALAIGAMWLPAWVIAPCLN